MFRLCVHLREIRITRNLTLDQLSNAIGFSPEEIREVELGREIPSLAMLIALADFYDVSLDFLAGRGDDPTRRDAPPILRQVIAKLDMLTEENLHVVSLFVDAMD